MTPPPGLARPAETFLTGDGDFQVLPERYTMGLYAAWLQRAGDAATLPHSRERA